MTKLIAKYEGEFKLSDVTVNCAVLNNGQRVISQNSVFKVFGRPNRGSRYEAEQGAIKLPAFADAKNLEPFIFQELEGVIEPIKFTELYG